MVRAGSERCGEVARQVIALELVDALRGGVVDPSGERGVGGLQVFDVLYPQLERADVLGALEYAAAATGDREIPLTAAG